jgi:hypothetical protein
MASTQAPSAARSAISVETTTGKRGPTGSGGVSNVRHESLSCGPNPSGRLRAWEKRTRAQGVSWASFRPTTHVSLLLFLSNFCFILFLIILNQI